jgi:inhibitor of cysteine peptidase
MKLNLRISLVISLTGCILALGCSSEQTRQNRGAATVIEAKADNPVQRQSASVYVGELFRVRLPVQSGAGFTWSIESGASESGIVNLVSRSVQTDQKAKPGAPAWEVFDLRANRAGETTVEFVYQRPWERNVPPAKRFSLTVATGY